MRQIHMKDRTAAFAVLEKNIQMVEGMTGKINGFAQRIEREDTALTGGLQAEMAAEESNASGRGTQADTANELLFGKAQERQTQENRLTQVYQTFQAAAEGLSGRDSLERRNKAEARTAQYAEESAAQHGVQAGGALQNAQSGYTQGMPGLGRAKDGAAQDVREVQRSTETQPHSRQFADWTEHTKSRIGAEEQMQERVCQSILSWNALFGETAGAEQDSRQKLALGGLAAESAGTVERWADVQAAGLRMEQKAGDAAQRTTGAWMRAGAMLADEAERVTDRGAGIDEQNDGRRMRADGNRTVKVREGLRQGEGAAWMHLTERFADCAAAPLQAAAVPLDRNDAVLSGNAAMADAVQTADEFKFIVHAQETRNGAQQIQEQAEALILNLNGINGINGIKEVQDGLTESRREGIAGRQDFGIRQGRHTLMDGVSARQQLAQDAQVDIGGIPGGLYGMARVREEMPAAAVSAETALFAHMDFMDSVEPQLASVKQAENDLERPGAAWTRAEGGFAQRQRSTESALVSGEERNLKLLSAYSHQTEKQEQAREEFEETLQALFTHTAEKIGQEPVRTDTIYQGASAWNKAAARMQTGMNSADALEMTGAAPAEMGRLAELHIELAVLREIPERKAEAGEAGTVTNHIQITNHNTIASEADADRFIEQLSEALAERVCTSGEGVYA